ncbi:MAG: CerR family C-terminal domain-containing protein [Planctomycetota bacterium]
MSQSKDSPRLEDLLTSFANAFVEPLADQTRSQRLMKLMNREMLDRHLPPNLFVDEIIKPTMAAMQQALVKSCPKLDQSKVPFVVFCLVGQLLHAIHVETMFDERDKTDLPIFDLDEAVKHIIKFSAAGIRAFAQEETQ